MPTFLYIYRYKYMQLKKMLSSNLNSIDLSMLFNTKFNINIDNIKYIARSTNSYLTMRE